MSLSKLGKSRAADVLKASLVPFVRYTHSTVFDERLQREAQAAIRRELDELRSRMSVSQPDNPCLQGYKVFSQVDEDGIIQEIFRRIPGHSNTFIEIGSGDGIENNTHYLALLGYRGIWVDADAASVADAASALNGMAFSSLTIKHMFVDLTNVASLLELYAERVGNPDIGLVSIDIDGNDLPIILKFLEVSQPQVLCVEYNAKFPPPVSVCVRYRDDFRWTYDDYHGASLQAFCDALLGYKLVCCSLAGANAFFVRRDLAAGFAARTPAELYQPLRYNLASYRPQHPPSLKWLNDVLSPAIKC
jgi:predicted RNA methylase